MNSRQGRRWTVLEQSRLATYRAEALAKRAGIDVSVPLWEGMNSSFFQRLIGLTTTHFGMSTPVINEERQARAFAILGESRRIAENTEREAARKIAQGNMLATDSIYQFELHPTPPDRDTEPVPARTAVRVPLILPAGVRSIRLEENGIPVPAALTDLSPLPDGRVSCEVRFVVDPSTGPGQRLDPEAPQRYQVHPASGSTSPVPVTNLKNEWLNIEFSTQTGIHSLKHKGVEIGGTEFLRPFVSYRTNKKPVVYPAARWKFLPLTGEQWDSCQRVRMRAFVPMQTAHGEYVNEFTYTFTLFDTLPHLYVDVEARYAATPSTETIHNLTQKLRRLMDLRWEEVAPFQVHPALTAPASKPLRVWKHNYMGITAYYDLKYGQVNRHNRNLDSFNHQVTAGWVAVSDGKHGLLLGENAEQLASMAFCPMRLREQKGHQKLWLNPFGSYYGQQASYSHLGANGLGADFLKAFSGFLKPNGPSYNGQTLHFSLLLAPYSGDEPSGELQAEAAAHFYPPEIVFQAVPAKVDALLPADIRSVSESLLREAAIAAVETVPAPTAFLANPSRGQVDLVWDAPRDVPVTGYEAAWREAGAAEWHTEAVPPSNRWQVPGLEDGREYLFKLRAVCGEHVSAWTQEQACVPGAVTGSDVSGGFALLPTRALVKLAAGSLWSVFRAIIRR